MNVRVHAKFIAWWVSVLLMATGVFWASYFGLIQAMWIADETYITSLIAAIFVVTNVYLGIAAYWAGYPIVTYEDWFRNRLQTTWFISEQLMALGMLGTVIGLIMMLANNFVAGDAGMQNMLAGMWKSMGLALYTNAVGLVCSIVLKIQVYVVGYGVDES